MSHELDQLSLINRWYRGYLPGRLGSRLFAEFVAENGELAKTIHSAKLSFRSDIPTACTDGEQIYMPATYLMPEFFDALGIPPHLHVQAALAAVNGSQVHEALHCRLSPCKIDKYLEAQHLQSFEQYGKLLIQAFNLVEDLFIERYARDNPSYHALSNFVMLKNVVLFGERQLGLLDEELDNAKELTPLDILRCLSFLKDRPVAPLVYGRFDKLGWSRCYEIPEQINSAFLSQFSAAESRIKIAIELCEYLQQLQDAGELAQMPELGENGSGDTIVVMIDSDGSGSPEQLAAGELPEEILKAIAASINDALEEREQYQRIELARTGGGIDESSIGKVKMIDAMDIRSSSTVSDVAVNHDWLVLGRALRYARSVAHTPGRARDEGTTLLANRLAHILIDGKVLAYRDASKMKRGVPETIMLLDGSGSMRGHHVSSKRQSLWEYVVTCALGGFTSMMQAHMPCAVYSHTTYGDYDTKPGPVVYGIAAFEMPLTTERPQITGNAKQRFQKVLQAASNSNYDGLAIAHVGKRFTSRPGSKLLIVMSDGQPAGSNYSGEHAIRHTIRCVNDLRRQGVSVICVSLVSEVVDNNNEIYGKEFNVHAYGGQLEAAIREIVSHISFH